MKKSPVVRAPVSEPVRRTNTVAKVSTPKITAPSKADPKSTVDGEAEPRPIAKLKYKVVRDSFTLPKAEYAILDGLKRRAAQLKRPTKKSEVLRAGIAALLAMSDDRFLKALDAVPVIKTGRPKRP